MLSWVSGAGYGLLWNSIGDALRQAASVHGDRTALVSCHQDITYNYNELLQRSEKFAEGLVALGLQKGDRVGIYSQNCAEWTIAQYACHLADLILVNINPAYQAEELLFTMNNVEVSALITSEHFWASDYMEIIRKIVPEVDHSVAGALHSESVPNLRHLIMISDRDHKGYFNFEEIYTKSSSDYKERTANVNAGQAANIQFTSGTTGNPKGAMLSHMNILNNAYYIARNLEYTKEDVIWLPVPLFHCFGMVMGNLCAMLNGASVVYPSDKFSPSATLSAMYIHDCTTLYGVPTMFNDVIREQMTRNLPLPHASKGITGGSSIPPDIVDKSVQYLSLEHISCAYGMTELSPIVFQTRLDTTYEKQTTTVGTVMPLSEVKIVKTEYDESEGRLRSSPYGAVVHRGEEGELWARGYNVMLGYWNDPEKTKEAITSDGWMRTGDLGVLDDEGYCRITGRIKDVIITGGENVYPSEVESTLRQHPSIFDAQIIGQPDPRKGEKIRAVLILKDKNDEMTLEDLREFWEGKMARYKIPRYLNVVDEYPLTATKKVIKNELKNLYNTKI